MPTQAIKSVLVCLFGVAALAGCASKSPTTMASSSTSTIQKGRIVAVEPDTLTSSSSISPSMAATTGAASSGSSAAASGAAGRPSAIVTVQNADGTQSRYSVTQRNTTFKVGDPVSVILNGDNSVITTP